MACDAKTLISNAMSQGYAKLSERDIEACILAAACANTGGGGSGSGSVLQYVDDPNTEGVLPSDVSKPALAYSQDGMGSIRQWNTMTLTWN